MLCYEPHRRDRTILPHGPFKALIALRPIVRCGYLGEYAGVDRLFEMARPRGAEPEGWDA